MSIFTYRVFNWVSLLGTKDNYLRVVDEATYSPSYLKKESEGFLMCYNKNVYLQTI